MERLSKIEGRIDGFDAKLDSIHTLLIGLTRFANKAAKITDDASGAPIPHSAVNRGWSTTESDITAHDGLEDDLAPVGDSLLPDDNGNTQYLGRSSNYSFTADAEMLVQSRLRGMGRKSSAAKGSTADNNNMHRNTPHGQGIGDWRDKEVIEDEEDANPLSGMAMHMGDMHMGVDSAKGRERSSPIEIAPRPSGLDESATRMLDEAAELAGVGGTKSGGDEDYYCPTKEEIQIILDRIYTNLAVGLPLFSNIPPAHLMCRLFESPSKFIAETEYDTSWVTIGYCLAYYGLGFELNTEDVVQRRKEVALKRAMARNAWASFKDLRLFLTPDIEHVQALMMLSIVAQDTSRPGLCWMLTCQACRLAQAMGLHRRVDPNSNGLTSADIELRKYIFWTLYVLDKSFSLSFGRTSCFQDYDCDVELPKSSDTPPGPDMAPIDVMACFQPEYFRAMVELAKLQSAVYKKLYSARASNTKGRSRSWVKETEKWVWELDSRLRMWKEGLITDLISQAHSTLLPKANRFHEEVIISLENMEFSYHTLMTMIHRRLFRPAAGEYDDGGLITGPNTRKRSQNILLHSARSAIHVVRKLGDHKNYMKTKWLIHSAH
ncbi:hypothetical protein L211DRAFT_132596 [Terfezia boudieri ATCC MYA-4762]|uniref:Xylanolytic transcriptional activator regulatory domain-containing protein n=1 Tax=Terfezia boudieri ATCC MYA-4762 TaxID=1051890 RepID=A0A3N4LWF9_9PEZI|nr:hypothetical protein L211DRAFT_132596 [Terfezia boudieri ATCC MYA-4762]